MRTQPVKIDWSYDGKADAAVGTGATPLEQGLGYAFGIVIPAVYAFLWITHRLDWTWWQFLVVMLIGCDMGAGVVANALNSCKRFYHTAYRPDEPAYVRWLKAPLFFTALHIYPLLISAFIPGAGWFYGIFWYGLLILCALLLVNVPLYVQRPIAFGMLLLSIVLNAYAIPATAGLEWFAPVLFLKIILGHLVREEPYRPAAEPPR